MNRHSLEKILECTLHCCNITREEWEGLKHKRKDKGVRVKQIVSQIAFYGGYDCSEISRFFGHHRTTAIHHIKTLRNEIRIYPFIQGLVDKIVDMLGPRPEEPQKQMVTYGYLARSCTGFLTISPHKPEMLSGYWMAEGSKPFPRDQFPQLTYESGPQKVKIVISIDDEEM